MQHIHMMVDGIVQGVGFRYFTMQKAYRYQIKGWVRNNWDGTVEIDAEGDEANMNAFLDAIKAGNGIASIQSVDVRILPDAKGYESFDVIYRS